jgi:hypothetical protein
MSNNYMQEQKNLKSKCCGAPVKLGGTADFAECGDSDVSQIGTCHFECSACGKPCGIINDALIWDRTGTTVQEVQESEPCCENCMFLYINEGGVQYCRRYPPRPMIDHLSKDGAGFNVNYYIETNRFKNGTNCYHYPLVSAEDWCGEYKRGKL